MSSIKINIDEIFNINNDLNENISRILNIESGLQSLRSNLDNRVLNRRSIGLRLSNSSNVLNNLELGIKKLQSFISTSMNLYHINNNKLNNLATKVGKITKGFAADGYYMPKIAVEVMSAATTLDKGLDSDNSIFDIQNKRAENTGDLIGSIEALLKSYKALTSRF